MAKEKHNTLFTIIKSSLTLDGPHLESDLRKIASFVNGKAKDAAALRAWACSHADLSSIETQGELRTKLASMTLAPGSTYEELEKHSRTYWATWSRIMGNHTDSPDSLQVFYMQWLSSMPALPEGSILSNVRKWLADKITDVSPLLKDVDTTIETLLKYARVIGLPNATATKPEETQLVVNTQHITYQGAKEQMANATVNVLRESKCDFCECYSCESRERGGIFMCICRWDSTFDISKTRFSDRTGDSGSAQCRDNGPLPAPLGATRHTQDQGGTDQARSRRLYVGSYAVTTHLRHASHAHSEQAPAWTALALRQVCTK